MKAAALAVVSQLGLVVLLSGGRISFASGVVGMAGAIIVGIEAGAQTAPDPAGAPPVDRALAAITSVGAALLLIGGPLCLSADASRAQIAIGLVIALAGGVIRGRAINTLGRAFVTASRLPERGLVTHGPFKRLRHPSELGLWLIAAGMGIAAAGVVTAVGCVAVIGSSVFRMRREDRMLRAAFGEQWSRWANRAGAVTPRLGVRLTLRRS